VIDARRFRQMSRGRLIYRVCAPGNLRLCRASLLSMTQKPDKTRSCDLSFSCLVPDRLHQLQILHSGRIRFGFFLALCSIPSDSYNDKHLGSTPGTHLDCARSAETLSVPSTAQDVEPAPFEAPPNSSGSRIVQKEQPAVATYS